MDDADGPDDPLVAVVAYRWRRLDHGSSREDIGFDARVMVIALTHPRAIQASALPSLTSKIAPLW